MNETTDTIKLNKNQRRFFETAVEHYRERSYDVRLKDLSAFADKNDLIIPTSALKKYCQGQVRGHYNLTLSGIKPKEPTIEYPLHQPKTFKNYGDMIIESSMYGGDDIVKKPIIPQTRTDYSGMKPINIRKPVYILLYCDDVLDAFDSLQKAFKATHRILHDHGTKTIKDVIEDIKYTAMSEIRSSNSDIRCVILAKEVL